MKRHKIVFAMLALGGWLGIGTGLGQAAPISPIGSPTGVTISIFQDTASGVDITDTYLPTWAPPPAALQTVYVVVNGSANAPTLATASLTPTAADPNPWLTAQVTSAYLGNCTNFGMDTGVDFTLSATGVNVNTPAGTKTGYALTSNDCGGRAVILVGTDKFVVPKDANLNGVPDRLENFGVALVPDGDNDGDGISNLDELRGFIVGGQHIRTNPTVKNLFIFLVKPQCGSPSLLGGGPVTYPPGTYAGALTVGSLTTNLLALISPPAQVPPGISGAQIHFLGASLNPVTTFQTDEWMDQFFSYTVVSGAETWKYCPTPNVACGSPDQLTVQSTTSPTAAITTFLASDRVINRNRVYGASQKGLRITECVDTSSTSPWGYGRWGSPNSLDEAVIYTKRIVNFVNGTGKSGDNIHYSTYTSGAWQPLTQVNTGTVTGTAARDFIISKAIQYIFAMEISHTVALTPSLTITFPHDATGFGSLLDAQLRAVTANPPTGVKYYIPSAYQGSEAGGLTLSP